MLEGDTPQDAIDRTETVLSLEEAERDALRTTGKQPRGEKGKAARDYLAAAEYVDRVAKRNRETLLRGERNRRIKEILERQQRRVGPNLGGRGRRAAEEEPFEQLPEAQQVLYDDIQARQGRIETVAEDPIAQARGEAQERNKRLLERVVPKIAKGSISRVEQDESLANFSDMATSGTLQLRSRGRRPKGETGLDPIGYVIENPYNVWVNGINPGGRVNVVSVEADGRIILNTGYGKRGTARRTEKALRASLARGDLRLVKGEAEVRPAYSTPKQPKGGGISEDTGEEEEPRGSGAGRGGGGRGGKRGGGKKKKR